MSVHQTGGSPSPVTDRSAQRRHVHLVEEVAERGIRRRPPQPQAECLGQGAVVADGKTLQIPQALATAEDSQHRHKQAGKRKPRRIRASGIDLT
jgi:hypothetical protein